MDNEVNNNTAEENQLKLKVEVAKLMGNYYTGEVCSNGFTARKL